ncbi:hypothetical protein BJ944DRAFT_290759 [Cunninghamella echinulata]|nr:hypothetical protein BJ944DRAFT_290759 [Cunninghamella echinulata]
MVFKTVTTERSPHPSLVNYFYQHTTYSIVLISLFLIAVCISIMASRSFDKIPCGHIIDQYTLTIQQYISLKIKNIKELPISNQHLFLNYDDIQYEEVYPLSNSIKTSTMPPENIQSEHHRPQHLDLSAVSKDSSVDLNLTTTTTTTTMTTPTTIKKEIDIMETEKSSTEIASSPTTTTTTLSSPCSSPTLSTKKIQSSTPSSVTGVHDKRKRKRHHHKNAKKKESNINNSNSNNKRYNVKEKNASSLSTNINEKYLSEMTLPNKVTTTTTTMETTVTLSNMSRDRSVSNIKKNTSTNDKHVKEGLITTSTTKKTRGPSENKNKVNGVNATAASSSTTKTSSSPPIIGQMDREPMKKSNGNISPPTYSIAPSPPSSSTNTTLVTDGMMAKTNRQSWYSPFNTGLEFDILSRSPPSPTHTYNSSSPTSSPLLSTPSSFNYTDYRLFPEPSRLPIGTPNFIQHQHTHPTQHSHMNHHPPSSSSISSIHNSNNNVYYDNMGRHVLSNLHHPSSSSSPSSFPSLGSAFGQHRLPSPPPPSSSSASYIPFSASSTPAYIPTSSSNPSVTLPPFTTTTPLSSSNSTFASLPTTTTTTTPSTREQSIFYFPFTTNTTTTNWYYPWKSRAADEMDHEQGLIPLNNNIKNNDTEKKSPSSPSSSSSSFSLFDRKLSFHLHSDK